MATTAIIKKPTAKRTAPKKAVKTSKENSKHADIVDPELRDQMIAEAAYFKSLNRDFQGDYCVEDWLEAETEIDTLFKN
ncbi:MAG: DUF2934 domain-containing protein [Gammaproteobacteria bacterium]|nr:DUF2934 domain-containing protein [Gammaproteobacteria bacterium]